MRPQAPQPTGDFSRTDDRLAATRGGYSPQFPLYQTQPFLARIGMGMCTDPLYFHLLKGILWAGGEVWAMRIPRFW